MSPSFENSFTKGPLGPIYLKTALPIIFVMGMNGLLTVVDALFLGLFVGPQALAAVTLMFPVSMLLVALSTLVSAGMSSVLARHLGAGNHAAAREVFTGAHGLAVTLGLAMLGLFMVTGEDLALLAAGGSAELAQLGLVYLQISMVFAPLMYLLSVHSDALRNEGRVGFMAAMSLLVSLSNMGFNYVLIAELGLGVAGSAYGTAAAQALSLGFILAYRSRGQAILRPRDGWSGPFTGQWRAILALGAPQSLNFLGLALGSAAILAALQWVRAPGYADTVTAYGIITRVITFTFLPLLGLSSAMQTITGNNFGAGLRGRAASSLRVALWTALVYCGAVQALFTLLPAGIAGIFVEDPAVIAEVVRILPLMAWTFFLVGPLMMMAMFFQAIGAAGKAALLGLSKPYLFAIPLTFALAAMIGERGIWLAGPVAELCLLVLTFFVLWHGARTGGSGWGLFRTRAEART